jgi:hypothetical protein
VRLEKVWLKKKENMNETTPEKYKVWLSPEKEVELLTQLCAALLRKTRSYGGEDPNLVIVGDVTCSTRSANQSVSATRLLI